MYVPVTIIIKTIFGEKAYDIDVNDISLDNKNVLFTDATGGRLIIYRDAIKTIIDHSN